MHGYHATDFINVIIKVWSQIDKAPLFNHTNRPFHRRGGGGSDL